MLALAAVVAQYIQPGDLIALDGELGAGKTQFVRGLARGMGIDDSAVSSPTFVIVQEYPPPEAPAPEAPETANAPHPPVLVHIDAYRIHSLDELESIGWDDLANTHRVGADQDTRSHEAWIEPVVVIEWADRLATQLTHDRLDVEIIHTGEGTRRVVMTPMKSWVPRMTDMKAALNQCGDQRNPQQGQSSQPPADAANHHPGDPPPSPPSRCPICSKPTITERESFPFCSKRCRQVDLSRWLGGQYFITRPIDASDLDET